MTREEVWTQNSIAIASMKETLNNHTNTLNKIEKSINTFISRADATYATKEAVNNIKDDVEDLKNNNRWLARTVGGIIITAIMGGLLIAYNYM